MYDDDDINYSYQNKDYVPESGNQQRPDRAEFDNNLGYHNLTLLTNLLKEIIATANATITVAGQDLEKYSLKVEPESRLSLAQEQEWPTSLGTPNDYISYIQYESLLNVRTRGAEFIRKEYETNVRGPFGTNSVDIIKAIGAIRSEALNIQSFIENYIGDVSETAEFRALELLQDWAENGLRYARDLGDLFTQRVQNPVQIPASEMDQITEADARNYQAFFQTKVNAVNREIGQLTDDLEKEHNIMSEVFFKKYFGPALKFQRNVSTPLGRKVEPETFLGRQAAQADLALSANYITLLTDQMKRTANFDQKMSNLTARIRVRDNYAGFTRELNGALENETVSKFITTDVTPVEVQGFKEYTQQVADAILANNEFRSDHELLDGKDSDEAHPQYLLRSGGNIFGNITMDDGITLDGMDPGEHRHKGKAVDGTYKIRGEDIEDLVTTAIDRDELMCYPINLRHINNKPITGGNNITLVNSQISWECDPALTFELQIVPAAFTPNPQPDLTWCVTTLYETGLNIVAGLGSDFSFFTFCTETAVYQYNWETGDLTTIAGSEGDFGDTDGDSLAARFSTISDLSQDYHDGRVYIADKDNRKVKMTGEATDVGTIMPTNVQTVYHASYPVKRIDTQGQNFLNTMYILIGPDAAGKDRVVKLVDTDGNNLQSGTYGGTEITKLSGVYADVTDIAGTPNGGVYLLHGNFLRAWDPNSNSVRDHDVSEAGFAPTAITSDQSNNIYITYSEA